VEHIPGGHVPDGPSLPVRAGVGDHPVPVAEVQFRHVLGDGEAAWLRPHRLLASLYQRLREAEDAQSHARRPHERGDDTLPPLPIPVGKVWHAVPLECPPGCGDPRMVRVTEYVLETPADQPRELSRHRASHGLEDEVGGDDPEDGGGAIDGSDRGKQLGGEEVVGGQGGGVPFWDRVVTAVAWTRKG
jgi:hypothetical protein